MLVPSNFDRASQTKGILRSLWIRQIIALPETAHAVTPLPTLPYGKQRLVPSASVLGDTNEVWPLHSGFFAYNYKAQVEFKAQGNGNQGDLTWKTKYLDFWTKRDVFG